MEYNTSPVRVAQAFAALNPYVETNIIAPTEKLTPGRGYYDWGERNAYPEYLLELSKTTPSLRAVINGTVDFIVGNGVHILPLPGTRYAADVVNTRGDTIDSQVADIARDYELYGGFALQVIRSAAGNVVEVYYCDLRFLRSNKENTVFYYSEKWKESRRKVKEYPAFIPFTPEQWARLTPEQRAVHYDTILFVKSTHSQVYPEPVYCAAIKACETERCIDDFHLNAINNGFAGSAVINFNNGVPSEDDRNEVERDVNEKFAGHTNAMRILLSWNEDKERATTVVPIKTEDFGERYKALATHCRQQIFTAFRANPNLFGIPTDSLGFSSEEYESSFRLYNRTCVRPVQRIICNAYDRIFGAAGVLAIIPFSLDEGSENNVK